MQQAYTPGMTAFEMGLRLEDFGIVPGIRRGPWVEPLEFFQRQLRYTPYRQQREFHLSGARIKVVAGAKRIGKSFMAAREVEPIIIAPETHGWIVGATYARARKEFQYIWDDLIRTCKHRTLEKNNNVRGGYMNIRFAQNSVVEVRSAKDENDLEVEALDWLILAEPAQHRESTFELCRERLSEKRGVMILAGTPPLARHWLKRRFDRGMDPGWEDYWSIRIPATETPYPGLDEVEKLERELSPLRYRRDILAEFVATEEIVYSTFEYPVHVDDLEYNRDWPIYWAFDFGYKSPWVCLWLQVDPSQDRVYVLDEYYQRLKSDSESIRAVKARHAQRGWNRTVLNVGDPHGAASRAELEEHGVFLSGMAGSQKGDVDRGVELVRQALMLREDKRPGLVVNRTCERTIDEFTVYHYAEGSQEKIAKEDDHAMDALRYFMLDRYGGQEPSIAWA